MEKKLWVERENSSAASYSIYEAIVQCSHALFFLTQWPIKSSFHVSSTHCPVLRTVWHELLVEKLIWQIGRCVWENHQIKIHQWCMYVHVWFRSAQLRLVRQIL